MPVYASMTFKLILSSRPLNFAKSAYVRLRTGTQTEKSARWTQKIQGSSQQILRTRLDSTCPNKGRGVLKPNQPSIGPPPPPQFLAGKRGVRELQDNMTVNLSINRVDIYFQSLEPSVTLRTGSLTFRVKPSPTALYPGLQIALKFYLKAL